LFEQIQQCFHANLRFELSAVSSRHSAFSSQHSVRKQQATGPEST